MFGATPGANKGFSFGGGSSNTASSGGNLFGGASNSTAPASGGLFGNNNSSNASSGGGLFGNNTSGTSNASSGGGLFGSNNNTTNASSTTQSGGLFGNNNNTSGGFGANTSKPGLFGGASNTTTNAAPASGGLFGNNAAKPATTGFGASSSTTNSGGLFGNKPAASGGLFGNTGGTTGGTTGTSGGLFGNNTTNTANTTANTAGNTSGGLFGAKPASGGLFGGSTANNNTSGGLFGSKPAASGGLFGSTNTTGQQPAQPAAQQSTGLFGNSAANKNSTAPSYAWTQPPVAVAQQPTASGGTTASVHTYTPAIHDQLVKISEQWDPSSARCVIKTHLYNKFTDEQMAYLMAQPRPASETPEEWDEAMAHRPGPNYYPLKITSFSEVAQRVETQLDQVARSRLVLQQLSDRQDQLSAKHDLDNATRLQRARARHTTLERRLLRLATVLAALKLKGYPLLPEEEEIARQFDRLNAQLTNTQSPVARISDLSARLAVLKQRADALNSELDSQLAEAPAPPAKDEPSAHEVVPKLTRVLLEQQIGLNYLNELVEKDTVAVSKKL
ncbi:nucleoporin Nup57p [Diutina catenulata]